MHGWLERLSEHLINAKFINACMLITNLSICGFAFSFCREAGKPGSGNSSATTSSTERYMPHEGIVKLQYCYSVEVKETVVLRTKPSVKADKVICQGDPNHPEDCTNGCKETFSTLPRGYSAETCARSANMDKVGKWENYWYEIGAPTNNCSAAQLWIFGEFLKVHN